MHRDTVIGIVGVVILVAAMVGVFTYERGQAGDLTPDGGLTTGTAPGPTASGNVALGASADSTLTFNETGMTNITFTLTWTPGAGVDTLRLVLAPAAGTGITSGFESEPEDDGEIVIVVPVNNTAADGALGVGDWQASVEFVSARAGTPGPPVEPPAGTPLTDDSVDFNIATTVEAYSSE